jgi:hypothetical protein
VPEIDLARFLCGLRQELKIRGDGMRHFSLGKWADFARDVVGQEEKDAMQKHLETGCKECAKVFNTWTRIHEAGRREAAYHPPESVVRTVQGLGALHGLGKASRMKASIAQLLFDSSRSPLPAGVRSGSVAARQLLYGVNNYRVDLRIQPQEDSDKVAVIGQILNSSDPDQAIGPLHVVLRKGKKVIAESVTNRFGEFHLECDLENCLNLQAGLPHGQVIQIPLVEPITESLPGVPELDESSGVKGLLTSGKRSTRKKV